MRCNWNGCGCVPGSERETSTPTAIPGWHKSTPPPLPFRSAREIHYNVTSLPQFLRNSSWPELPLHSTTQRERKRPYVVHVCANLMSQHVKLRTGDRHVNVMLSRQCGSECKHGLQACRISIDHNLISLLYIHLCIKYTQLFIWDKIGLVQTDTYKQI